MRLDGRLNWADCTITSLATAVVLMGSWAFPVGAEPFATSPTIPSVLASTVDGDTVVIPQEPLVTTDPSARSVWDGMVGGPVSVSGPSAPEAVFVDSAPSAVMDPEGIPVADAGGIPCYACENQGSVCHSGGCGDPPGLLQYCQQWHDKGNACWIGRADALLLFRDAPPNRPLVEQGTGALPVLNANTMNSPLAAGPRVSLFRFNRCNDTGIEVTYLRAANWRSMRPLAAQPGGYLLSAPGMYGNTINFDAGSANLGAAVQSLEWNRHWLKGQNLRFLAGFRWVEWKESYSLATSYGDQAPVQDFFNTNCINSLYGGQIGLDALLLTTSWFRIDSVIKGGAYYNNAVQTSLYQSNATGPLVSESIRVNESPLNCSFVGELGVTGVVPITNRVDLRVGYFGMWLSGIAQPTQQLSGQVLTQPNGGREPASGTINANGTTLVQGVSLGLEGRW